MNNEVMSIDTNLGISKRDAVESQTFSRLSMTSGVNVETLASAAFVDCSLSSADSPASALPTSPPSSLAFSSRSLALLFLGPNSIEKISPKFQLEKWLEFWFEITYTHYGLIGTP